MSANDRRKSKPAASAVADAAKPRDKTHLASDPLRREAEQRWAESERSATHRQRRGQAKSRAQAQRRQADRDLRAQVAYLTKKLAETEQQLARHLGDKKKTR
jgi:hypothetical protein